MESSALEQAMAGQDGLVHAAGFAGELFSTDRGHIRGGDLEIPVVDQRVSFLGAEQLARKSRRVHQAILTCHCLFQCAGRLHPAVAPYRHAGAMPRLDQRRHRGHVELSVELEPDGAGPPGFCYHGVGVIVPVVLDGSPAERLHGERGRLAEDNSTRRADRLEPVEEEPPSGHELHGIHPWGHVQRVDP
jgi:hypothetical protein